MDCSGLDLVWSRSPIPILAFHPIIFGMPTNIADLRRGFERAINRLACGQQFAVVRPPRKFSAKPSQLRLDEHRPGIRRIFVSIKPNADHKISLSHRDGEEPAPILLRGPFINHFTPLRNQPINQPLRAVVAKTTWIDEVILHVLRVEKFGYKCDVSASVFTHCSTNSFLTVKPSIRFSFTSYPIPTPAGRGMFPRGVTSTGGVMMSSAQYRFDADTSPGSVKPGSVDIAMLCARPIPASSMPPHQTGTLRPWQ